MGKLYRELRHLNALLVFEAAGRHGNFTAAAEELCVTRVAISRQVKTLEDDLGAKLFNRMHRGVSLTDTGRQLFETASTSLGDIARLQQQIKCKSGKTHVNVTTTVAFAAFWLMPKLGTFRDLYPETDLRLIVSDRYLNLREDNVDVAIRWEDAKPRGPLSTKLFPGASIPVCSPDFAARHAQVKSPGDLLTLPLIYLEGAYRADAKWPDWFKRFGLTLPAEPNGMFVDSYTSMVQAAIAGQGVALGDTPFLDHFIDQGSLVWPIKVKPIETGVFNLIRTEDSFDNEAATRFCEWLRLEVTNTGSLDQRGQ